MSLPRLYLSTRNLHKLQEFQEILADSAVVLGIGDLHDFPEVEETGTTFEENSALKALALSRHLPSEWVMADDSGLEVDALDGQPGVLSARYSGRSGDDAANRQTLARNLRAKEIHQSPARFRCVITIARDGVVHHQGAGHVEGQVQDQERGTGGFGYDAMFYPAGYRETFAELPSVVKNQLSHRALAIQAVATAIKNLAGQAVS